MPDQSQSNILLRLAARRGRARDALVAVLVTALLLVLFAGDSVRREGEQMDAGWERTLVLAVGEPAGWVADRLPLAEVADDLTAWLSPDEDLGGGSGFDTAEATDGRSPAAPGGAGSAGLPPVTTDYFDPLELGERPERPPELETLLVTGDSLAMPLDTELAKRAGDAFEGIETVRDPHVGTGISKTGLADWSRLSAGQVERRSPEAVVVFIGANEGFDLPGPRGRDVACCGAEWAALYARRVRRMMDTYRQRGSARVYWLTLPLPRDDIRQEIARAVNAAIEVAAQPLRRHVRVLDLVSVFTPDGYRDAIEIDGEQRIVRESDGVHLNAEGSRLAAERVLDLIQRDFGD